MRKLYLTVGGVYAILLAVFLIGAFLVTGGVGWEFFGAIVIAILTLPLLILVFALLCAIRTLRTAEKTRFERILSVISVCLAVLSALSLVALSIVLVTHIKNDAIRHFISDVAPLCLLFCCVGNLAILLDRVLSGLVLFFARKRNPEVSAESRGVLIARGCLIAALALLLPLASIVGRVIELLW